MWWTTRVPTAPRTWLKPWQTRFPCEFYDGRDDKVWRPPLWTVGPAGRRPIQQPQGVLALVSRVRTKLVRDPLLPPPVGASITDVNGSEVLPFVLPTDGNPLLETSPLGCIVDGLTGYISKWFDGASPVTFNRTRCGTLKAAQSCINIAGLSPGNEAVSGMAMIGVK